MKSSEGKTFKTENPANGQVIAEVQQAGKADVDKAVKAAQDAFKFVHSFIFCLMLCNGFQRVFKGYISKI